MEAWGVADDLVTVSQPADRVSHGYTHTNARPAPCLSGTRKTGAPDQPWHRMAREVDMRAAARALQSLWYQTDKEPDAHSCWCIRGTSGQRAAIQ